MTTTIERTVPKFKSDPKAIPTQSRDKIEQLKKLGMTHQLNLELNKIRGDIAVEAGFRRITLEEAGKMLLGDIRFKVVEGASREISFVDPALNIKAEMRVPTYQMDCGRWPFRQTRLLCRSYNKLAVDVPYGITLLMSEALDEQLFDTFLCVAPVDAWQKENSRTYFDPVMLGVIYSGYSYWLSTERNYGTPYSSGPTLSEYFFIGKW